MIGWLTGVVLYKKNPDLLLDVNGVGYELQVPTSTFDALPEVKQHVSLYIHHQLRENGQSLFAFSSASERDVFRQLIRINSIGAKLALVLLSGMNIEELRACVDNNDIRALSRLPGIGKKTAERLVMELQNRIFNRGSATAPTTNDTTADAISALIALGLKAAEATHRVQSVQKTNTKALNCEQIVRLALQSMA